MDALAIGGRLRELAIYLRLDDEPFRARAYERAASTIEALHDLERRIEEDSLAELPGIGPSLARVVIALAQHDEVALLTRLRERWPAVIVELSQVHGIGLRKARALVDALGPRDLDELTELAAAGRVRTLPGFGAASEAKLLASLRERRVRRAQRTLPEARRLAAALIEHLVRIPDVVAAHPAGGVRRWLEIVEPLTIVVATAAPGAVRDRLAAHPLVTSVSDAPIPEARLAAGGHCELHLARPSHVGAALIVATGSSAHVAALRARAAEAGHRLEDLEGDEAAVYAALGLPWLPPEVRDGDDELDGRRFDDLVTVADVQGAVHCHTTYSDGRHSIEQMAAAAAERGLRYLTITDHSRSAFFANGLDDDRLRAQAQEIAEVQATTPVQLLRGTESDILRDGQLDYDDGVLRDLDVVIASIHQRHKLDEDGMTQRLVTAMRQPIFKIWGHALGRLILRRDPIACRVDEVLDAIAGAPAAIELNGDPHRLDLDPTWARAARARGIKFVVSSDAHSARALDNVEYAVALARRARLRPADVLNTLDPEGFRDAVRPAR